MGHLRPIEATYTQEDVDAARAQAIPPAKIRGKGAWKTVDGIVDTKHPNHTYDVTVPGRSHPFTELHCIIPGVDLYQSQGCVIGFFENQPDLAMIIAAKFVGRHPITGTLSLGEWMQAEGNWYLSQPGLVDMFPAPTTTAGDLVADMGLTAQEEYGMARMLGFVAGDGVFFTAAFVGNGAMTACDFLQVQAWRLGATVGWLWTLNIPYACALPDAIRFRANLFYDVDARVLTIAHLQLWSIKIPTTGTPTVYATTDLDCVYRFSAAGKYGLHCPSGGYSIRAYLRGDNLQWVPVGSAKTLTDYGAAMQWLSPSVSRPWPFWAAEKSWCVLWNGPNRQTTLSRLTNAGASSATTTGPTSIASDIVLQASVDAGEVAARDFAQTLLILPATVPGQQIDGDYVEYAGELAMTTHPLTPYSPFWAVDGIFPTYSISPFVTLSPGYLCPRTISQPGSATTDAAQWSEDRSAGAPTEAQPGLHQDSAGNLIYAKIETILASVAGNRNVEKITYEGYSYPNPNPDPAPGTEILYSNLIQVYHFPDQICLHKTTLRKVSKTGTLIAELDLSSGPFTGLTHDGATCSESLLIPENVWEIKLGTRPDTGATPTAWDDAIFLLQDTRTAATDAPTIALRAISPALEILCTVPDLSVAGDQVTAAKLFVSITPANKWAIVALYSLDEGTANARLRWYVFDLSDLSGITMSAYSEEVFGPTNLPKASEFERFCATQSGIFWPGTDPADGLTKIWKMTSV